MEAREGVAALLVFARVAPLALSVAAVTRAFVPREVALALALALTCAFHAAAELPALDGLDAVGLALVRELCIGGVFALAMVLAVLTVRWAVSLAWVEDEARLRPAVGAWYALCATWSVLALGGHRAVLVGLAESYRDAPIGGRVHDAQTFALGVAQLVADAVATALAFALPLLVACLCLDVVGALAARLLAPRDLPFMVVVRPLAFTLTAALLLVSIAGRAPEAARAGIEAARALTRAAAR
jgi:flagellar biosynthesis protein FliR